MENAHKQLAWDSLTCLVVDDDKGPFFILYAVAIPLVLSAKELPPVL